MKNINQLLKPCFLPIIIGIFIFVIFRKPIETIFTTILVDPIFSRIETSIWKDLIFIFLLILLIYIFTKTLRKRLFHENYFIVAVFSFFVYGYYRFISTEFIQEPFLILTDLKYSDFIFIICSVPIYCYYNNNISLTLPSNIHTSFVNDKSIGVNGLDKLSYTNYAKSLANQIHSSYFDSSFAIGINGKWGEGKTSFLDLVKKKLSEDNLKNEELIEVNFNAWSIQNPNGIIEEFFITFKEALQPYGYLFSDSIINYSNKLKSINSDYQSTIETLTNLFQPSSTLSKQLNLINVSLKKLNKKIIVYIDDLDRLNVNEILEVLKLIRINANFYNTFFIVAYDRMYIKKALIKNDIHNPEIFLEKIFQMELSLPIVDQQILEKELIEKINIAIPEKFHADIIEIVENKAFKIEKNLFNWIKNLRDVTRLSNHLKINLIPIIEEVNIHDFIRIEILKIKFPFLYELLSNSYDEIIEAVPSSNQKDFHYRLKRTENEPPNSPNSFLRVNKKNYAVSFDVSESYLDEGIELVEDIFQDLSSRNHHRTAHLSIENPRMYFRYFALALYHGNLSEKQFTELWSKDLNDIKIEIDTLVNEGKRLDLMSRLERVNDFDNIEHFEKVIKIYFFLPHIQTSQEFIAIDRSEEIINKFYRFNNQFKNNSDLDDDYVLPSAIQNILKDILLNARTPYYESEFISFLSKQDPPYIYSLNYLQYLVISYLDRYISEINSIDSHLFRIFHDCKFYKKKYFNNNSYSLEEEIPSKAIELMKYFFITKVYDEFLLFSLRKSGDNSKIYAIKNELILMLFNDWDNFELEVLSNVKESNYREEYKSFYSKYSDQNHSKFIIFDFNTIPVEKISH